MALNFQSLQAAVELHAKDLADTVTSYAQVRMALQQYSDKLTALSTATAAPPEKVPTPAVEKAA